MQESSRVIVGSVLLSLLAGSFAGGLTVVYGPSLLQHAPAPHLTTTSSTALNEPHTLGDSLAQEFVEEQNTIDVVKRVSPAVVSITITKELTPRQLSQLPNDFFSDFFGQSLTPTSTFLTPRGRGNASSTADQKQKLTIGGGSGFFVSEDGMLVTNKHVVSDTGAEYTVVTQDGKKYPAKVLALDPSLDLAIIKVEGSGFPFLNLGNSDTIMIGQTVIAIGNALAEFQNTVTKGVVSGMNRHLVAGGEGADEVIEGAIQTDAAINPGNSGGPLIDLHGQVIGVNTAISENAQSLGFALPINMVKFAVESVKKNGKIVRPWLGVRYTPITDDFMKRNNLPYNYGALVQHGATTADLAVIPGSPADKAGIVENDILLELDGVKLDENHSLATMVTQHLSGDKVKLKIFHKGEEKVIEITLEDRKEVK
jgi:serine protease Do